MAREERPDRAVAENIQTKKIVEDQPVPNFGPTIRTFNIGDILVDIDDDGIDFYYVADVGPKQTILNNGESAMGMKTKLVKKLVESGAWKVYTEGFKIQQSLDTTPPPKEKPKKKDEATNKKANDKQKERSERPTRR